MRKAKNTGVSLIEVVVGAGIVILVLFSLIGSYILQFREGLTNAQRIQSALLAEEAVEIVKFWRDSGWTANIAPLSTSVNYYLSTSTGPWSATTTTVLALGKFTRTIRLQDVNRDSNGIIVFSGGTPDPGTRLLTATVSWPTSSGSTTRTLSTYVMNIFSN